MRTRRRLSVASPKVHCCNGCGLPIAAGELHHLYEISQAVSRRFWWIEPGGRSRSVQGSRLVTISERRHFTCSFAAAAPNHCAA